MAHGGPQNLRVDPQGPKGSPQGLIVGPRDSQGLSVHMVLEGTQGGPHGLRVSPTVAHGGPQGPIGGQGGTADIIVGPNKHTGP